MLIYFFYRLHVFDEGIAIVRKQIKIRYHFNNNNNKKFITLKLTNGHIKILSVFNWSTVEFYLRSISEDCNDINQI